MFFNISDAKIDCQDSNGNTPLHIFVQSYSFDSNHNYLKYDNLSYEISKRLILYSKVRSIIFKLM